VKKSPSRPAAVALFLLAGLWMCCPVRADWLVTRDGGRIETKGPWKVDGKRVVFSALDGTLSSLRMVEVDLDASRQATAADAAEAKAPAAPLPARKSVRVLTDKDFSHPAPPAAAPDAAAGERSVTQDPASGADVLAGPVQLVDWNQRYNQEEKQMEITGSVRNAGTDIAAAVSVVVRLFDDRNQPLAERQASLNTRSLKAGQDTSFSATFPGVMFFGSAKFEIKSFPLKFSAGSEPPPAVEQPPAPPPF
jgi:hypothetical protein